MCVRIVLELRSPPRPGIDRSCLTDYRQWPFILPIMKPRQLRQRLDDGAIGDLVQLLAELHLPPATADGRYPHEPRRDCRVLQHG